VTLEVKDKGYLIKGNIVQEGDLYNLNLPLIIFTEKGREEILIKIEERAKRFSFKVLINLSLSR